MPVTWIDIADSAVKIGLGGIIGGIATVLVGHQKNKHEVSLGHRSAEREKQKELRANRRRLVEAAATSIDSFFRLHERLAMQAGGSAATVQKFKSENNELSPEKVKELRQRFITLCGDDYFDGYHSARTQIAMLKLASATEAADALTVACRTAVNYRDLLTSNGANFIPTVDQAKQSRREFRQKREVFEDTLSNYYAQL
ncbi:hypothetical protein [Paraburkholderia sp. MM5477-R1]|uniref:hypothetical protein n=1 Tax=Paraburkholderia sp. MM5477-R1 TaxID=2991062 RepID=UPI003D25C1A1